MDKVKITCYGKTEVMERKEAVAFYSEGVAQCEGSEKERYANIVIGLLNGAKEVSDQ